MKKVVVAGVILLVILTAGILESVFVDKLFDALDDRLYALEDAIHKEDDGANEQIKQLTSWWEKRRNVLELFTYSPDVRAFSVALAEAEGSLECDDYQNALSKVQSLIVMSSNIHRILDFNIEDIV